MKKNILSLLAGIIIITALAACGENKKTINELNDIGKDVSIGAMTGTTGEALAKKRFPEAEVKSFDDIMDAIAALKSNQLDAVITGYPAAFNVCKHNTDLKYLPEPADTENTAIALRKGNPELRNELNSFIDELIADGTLNDMKRRWFKEDFLPYEIPEIKMPAEGEILKIGVSATREPFCFVDENREVTGHDGELARRISARLNRPIQFVDMKFSALIPALQSGKIDLIVTGMTATEERAKSVDFTKSYFLNSQVIIAKKNVEETQTASVKLRTLEDLKTKRIGVLLGSTHDTFIQQNYPNAQALQYKSPPELLLAVRTGKVDAAVYTTETLKGILQTEKEFQIFGDTLFSVPVAMGFNKESDELREKFNEFLKTIKENGVYGDMVERWINKGESLMPEIKNTKENGTLTVGIVSDKGLPFTILKNNKIIGFDIEIAERFAAYLGKEFKIADMDFGSLIAAAASKKIDMISSTLMITEERAKQIDFSDQYMRLGASMFALKNNIEETSSGKLKVLDDIAEKSVGVYEGTVHDAYVANKYPKAEIKRFTSTADVILSLKTNKIDVALLDLISSRVLMKSNPEIGILTDEALTQPLGFGFNKNNPELRKKFNNFLKTYKENGSLAVAYQKWCVEDPEQAVMPQIKFKEDGKLIRLGVAVADLPYVAVVNGKYVGIDIEIMERFAEQEGYQLKIIPMEFAALIASLAAGKVDIIADGISITEERGKQIDFSDTYMDFKTAVIALKENIAAYDNETTNQTTAEKPSDKNFLDGIADSFYSNIILENRYLLIIDGLKTTAIISIFATIFGTILGGLICFMRMSKRKILFHTAKIYISILRGTPVLVLLMIIFYVVFASVDIEPSIVAVIAFGLNFAAYVSEMYRTGIESIDRGQTEAGIAMGFTKVKTFIYIILPQAARRILPVYKGELISLVKMTSIVGYIAVQDLTKASDIIRSRTFDAFFPLIMVAVLYFLISWLLLVLLEFIERKTNPKLNARRN